MSNNLNIQDKEKQKKPLKYLDELFYLNRKGVNFKNCDIDFFKTLIFEK